MAATKQEIADLAWQCESLKEFYQAHEQEYMEALTGDFLADVCPKQWRVGSKVRGRKRNEPRMRNPRSGFWTKSQLEEANSRCIRHALMYKTRSEFCEKSKSEYEYARKHGLLDDVCAHMPNPGGTQNRFLYLIFDEVSVYVGLTYDIDVRMKQHKKMMSLSFSDSVRVVRTIGDYPATVAQDLESKLIEHFRVSGRWKLVNLRPGGSLGGGYKMHSEKDILKFASCCRQYSEFRSTTWAYQGARRRGILPVVKKIIGISA